MKTLAYRYFGLICIFAISLIPLFDLFHAGLPLTHDGQDHVGRIANFYQSFSEGNLVPRWAGNLNWGFGHPILMFLYPLPSYFASLFHFLGFSFVDSLKIVFGFSFIASGLAMYLWIKEFLGEEAGIIAGVLYLFAPYRFVDLYVRGAIGEHVAFVFPPLVLYGLYKLSKKYSYWTFFLASVSVAGLILSHNAISIMFLPFFVAYSIYLFFNTGNKKKFLYFSMFSLAFGILLSSFFLLPAFFEGKYTLRDIVTSGEYFSRFVNPASLLYSPWNYGISGQFSVQIGLLQLGFVALCFVNIVKQQRKVNKLLFLILGFFAISIFLMVKESGFIWTQFTTLQKFQFPWRFLTVTVFSTAVMAGLFTSTLNKRHKKYLIILVILFAVLLNKDFFHAKGYLQKPESFYTGIYPGTTDTGESSPIWSIRFMEEEAKERVEVIGGKAEVQELKRDTASRKYFIKVDSDTAKIKENTLYFPGWNVFVDGKKTTIEFQDQNNRGIITFPVSHGNHTVSIIFKDTNLRKFANLISVSSLVLLIFLGIFFKIRKYEI